MKGKELVLNSHTVKNELEEGKFNFTMYVARPKLYCTQDGYIFGLLKSFPSCVISS